MANYKETGEQYSTRWLDGWSCADGYSLRRHFVVVTSRGDRVLPHFYESQGSAACKGSFSRFAPFQVKNDVSEVDHGVLNRLVKDLRVEGCNAYGFGETCSVLEYLSELEDSLRFDHQEERRQRVHYDELFLAEMFQSETSALSNKVRELERAVNNLFRLFYRVGFREPLNPQSEYVDE